MNRYSSNIWVRLPLFVPAIFFLIIGLIMFYVCFAETSIQLPTFIEKFCIFAMAAFLTLVAATFVRIALKDFYQEIVIDHEKIFIRQIFDNATVTWPEIKTVNDTAATLTITTIEEKTVNIGADVTGFEEIKQEVISRYNEIKRAR